MLKCVKSKTVLEFYGSFSIHSILNIGKGHLDLILSGKSRHRQEYEYKLNKGILMLYVNVSS